MVSIVWRNSDSQWQEYPCESCDADGFIDEWISLSSPPPDGSIVRLKLDQNSRFGVIKDGAIIEAKKIDKVTDSYDSDLKKLSVTYGNRWDLFWGAIKLPQHAMWIACKCGVEIRKILKALFECVALFAKEILYANDRLLTSDFVELRSYFQENDESALDRCAWGLVPYFGNELDLLVDAQERIVTILRDPNFGRKILVREVSPFMGLVSLAQFPEISSDSINFQRDALAIIKSNISCCDLVVGHGKLADRKSI